ncbi:hypothetical protein I2I05_02560 [Hymenobacter sp. BT683]|uniref:UspA domain-containing protein n=1 Tax=Hymenobacter jeongseonensis TaxID=2791027 RepID=A0ABS0ID42_9BACT|nr:hypothetical protein [Hymenobacter jeongseonensis]MBF9236268.1 hypothetical protein [Hymenobacter jeongseonensis]
MSTSIVVLSEGLSSSQEAVSYAAHLARTMAVPLREFRVNTRATQALESSNTLTIKAFYPGNRITTIIGNVDDSRAVMPQELAAALVEQEPLLVVMQRLPSTAYPLGQLAKAVHSLLQTTRQPLLLVPENTEAQAPPLRIALVTDGDPFTLVHGQRAMHALLLTLPIKIAVLHAPIPKSYSSLADALQSVLACGLATRYPSIAALEIQADNLVAGILAGVKQIRADLLVLIIRHRSLAETDFCAGTMAALFQQSPIPVLLLLATDT